MADYAPPTGPPPPRVPEGWKAVFNDQYKEWFYVNLYTKQSTWEKPTAPAHPPGEDAPPGGPPPLYSGPGSHNVSDAKRRSFESNNPYKQGNETDEELARRLQAEENTRRDRGEAEGYYQGGAGAGANPAGLQGGYPGAPSSTSPTGSGGKKGFFSKLMGKQHGGSGGGYPQQPAGYQQGYPPQGAGYGGYGGYGPGPGYGGYGPPAGYGYGQPQYMQQAPARRQGGGLGTGGAAALGLGGGLLGGMMLGEAMDGGDGGGDYGGDGGGGDGGDGGGDG